MVTVNHNYLKLPGSYLFSTIGKKVKAYQAEHTDARIISLGIGDVTQPLVPAIIDSLIRPWRRWLMQRLFAAMHRILAMIF